MRWISIVAITATLILGFARQCAADAGGQVAQVNDRELLVRLDAGGIARSSDAVEIYVEIEGVGPAMVASGVVAGMRDGFVLVEVTRATGKVMPGQKARFIAATSTIVPASPPAPVTPSAAPNTRATLDFLWIIVPEGYLLWGVLPDGSAAQAGLKNGDVVIRINGESPFGKLVNADAGPLGVLKDRRPGERVVVDYLRDDQPRTTNLTLVASPEDHGLARLRPLAEQGVPWAVHAVGVVHYMNAKLKAGPEAEHEYAEALPWFLRASATDFAWSHLLLGHMYAAGNGVAKNDVTSLEYYEKARRAVRDRLDRLAGNIADVTLGLHYLNASPSDDLRALGYIREAAEGGRADGQNILGWMYEHGRGVAQNREEAIRWYRKAAAQGHKDAKQRLGKMGVEP
jgi:hypothetical protein